jgi:L-fuconolactonase
MSEHGKSEVIDAHAHCFRPASVVDRVVDELAPADRDAPADDYLAHLDAAGIARAILVPLSPAPAEAVYLAGIAASHPGRFLTVALAGEALWGLTDLSDAEAWIRDVDAYDCRAVRTQWLGDPADRIDDSPMLPTLRRMAAAGRPLWSYLPPDQFTLLEQLVVAVPDLPIVLNHLGFCPHDMKVDAYGRPRFENPFPPELVTRIAALGRYARVHLMVSGQYALSSYELSTDSPPYPDLAGVISRLADEYGADRMMWASDYPWIRDFPGYQAIADLPARTFPDASPSELAALTGGTVRRLFEPW